MSTITSIEQHPGCINTTLRIIGEKWTALILKELTSGPKTFSEIETLMAGISPRTLSQRLDKLEQESIVIKKIYCQHPPRHTYELTAKGQELESVLRKMAEWGAKYS